MGGASIWGHSGVTCPRHPSSPPLAAEATKMLSCISSGALYPLLVQNPGGGMSWAWPHHRVLRVPGRPSDIAESKAHCPESSTWERASPVHPLNAGAPSSKLSDKDQTIDPTQTGQDQGEDGIAHSEGLATSRNVNPLTQDSFI